jgi:hypothetical protein
MFSTKTIVTTLSLLAAGSFQASAIFTPVNPVGGNGSEQSLQQVFNANGFSGIDVLSDAAQLDDSQDSFWTLSGAGSASMIIEIAGYAGNNTFGIYNPFTNEKQQIFAGGDGAGATASITTAWSVFGFYLDNQTNGSFTWYSDSSLNAGGANDHMVAYGTGAGYVLAWEDLNLGDWDYQDMVVTVSGVTTVPDGGATLVLLGGAIAAMGFTRRRK